MNRIIGEEGAFVEKNRFGNADSFNYLHIFQRLQFFPVQINRLPYETSRFFKYR